MWITAGGCMQNYVTSVQRWWSSFCKKTIVYYCCQNLTVLEKVMFVTGGMLNISYSCFNFLKSSCHILKDSARNELYFVVRNWSCLVVEEKNFHKKVWNIKSLSFTRAVTHSLPLKRQELLQTVHCNNVICFVLHMVILCTNKARKTWENHVTWFFLRSNYLRSQPAFSSSTHRYLLE